MSDNGRGIDPDVLPRIFEPFFSTKGEDGYGLGLTVVKAAVEALGGHIDVSSTPGVMTTFRLDFPIAAAAASA
ncbi:MAG: ATP-binding protein [Myxococcota bacterium]